MIERGMYLESLSRLDEGLTETRQWVERCPDDVSDLVKRMMAEDMRKTANPDALTLFRWRLTALGLFALLVAAYEHQESERQESVE